LNCVDDLKQPISKRHIALENQTIPLICFIT